MYFTQFIDFIISARPSGGAKPPPRGPKPSLGPKPNARPKCRALWDYAAQDTDELGLKEGDMIEIVRKGKQFIVQSCSTCYYTRRPQWMVERKIKRERRFISQQLH